MVKIPYPRVVVLMILSSNYALRLMAVRKTLSFHELCVIEARDIADAHGLEHFWPQTRGTHKARIVTESESGQMSAVDGSMSPRIVQRISPIMISVAECGIETWW